MEDKKFEIHHNNVIINGTVCPKDFKVKINNIKFEKPTNFSDLSDGGALFETDSDVGEMYYEAVANAGLSKEYDKQL